MLSQFFKALLALLAIQLANALPSVPAENPFLVAADSTSQLERRESSCSSQGDNFNFPYDELDGFYNSLNSNPDAVTTIDPNTVLTYYYGSYLKVAVQNEYVVNVINFTNGQLAHALSFIFCCNGNGQCSDGRAVFPSSSGLNLVVFTCNVSDECHE